MADRQAKPPAGQQTVGIVSPRYPPAIGGVERHVEELAHGLARRGVAVEVITTDPTGRLDRTELVDGIPVRRFGTIAHDGVFFLSPGLARWLVANAGRYGLIHGHSYHTPLVLAAAIAARRSHLPFVLTPHYHGTGHTPARAALHRPYKMFGARVVHAARTVICVSASEQELIERDFGLERSDRGDPQRGRHRPAPGRAPANGRRGGARPVGWKARNVQAARLARQLGGGATGGAPDRRGRRRPGPTPTSNGSCAPLESKTG